MNITSIIHFQSEVEFFLIRSFVACELFAEIRVSTPGVVGAHFRTVLEGMDVFYHLAFVVERPMEMRMATIYEINVDGTKNVFQASLRAGVPKIVHTSSLVAHSAHVDNQETLTEDFPLLPDFS
jgi:nucleoside-diphosphate-sugar epimerase